jgi:hypothetical protein
MKPIINIISCVTAFALANGCIFMVEEPEETDSCVWEGVYETSSYTTPECGGTYVIRQAIPRQETDCDKRTSTPEANTRLVCEPGDPTMECSGYVNTATGCLFEIHVRRL